MTCELCDAAGGHILWKDASCRVVEIDEPGYPGFCRVVWNRHVKEMTDLAPQERARLLLAVFAVETALRELMRPDKVNLACLGNVTPHLHWHVIPRFRDDPHFPLPIWAPAQRPATRKADPALAAAIAAKLGATLAE